MNAVVLAEYQWYGDGDPQVWAVARLTEAQTDGLVAGWEIHGAWEGEHGIVLISFSIGLRLTPVGETYPQVKVRAQDVLERIVGEADVEVRWVSAT